MLGPLPSLAACLLGSPAHACLSVNWEYGAYLTGLLWSFTEAEQCLAYGKFWTMFM